jgi:hypothetical protein
MPIASAGVSASRKTRPQPQAGRRARSQSAGPRPQVLPGPERYTVHSVLGHASIAGPWCSSPSSDPRITRVFPCAGRERKARASFKFAGCCWWRSLAVDSSPGHLGGTHARLSVPVRLAWEVVRPDGSHAGSGDRLPCQPAPSGRVTPWSYSMWRMHERAPACTLQSVPTND